MIAYQLPEEEKYMSITAQTKCPTTESYLSTFLLEKLHDYITMKAYNDSNSPIIPEGNESISIIIQKSLPQRINRLVADFYSQQGFKIAFRPSAVFIEKDGKIVKYVVITEVNNLVRITVKKMLS
jgi:hypothetical protein